MIRKIFAVITGIIAGALLSMAIGAGLQHRFPDEFKSFSWGVFLWGDHWFLRALASMISSAWAGFITGLIGRERGKILAIVAVFPSWILWVIAEYAALTGHFPLFDIDDFYVSLGNKISMGLIILAIFPVAWNSGAQGEIIGREYSTFFDSRKHTLLGIKWYHYTWLPIVLYLIVLQGAFAGLYFLTWLKALWKSGFSLLGSIIPSIFTFMIFGTLYLMALGVQKTYLILAGFEEIASKGRAVVKVLQYAIGFQIIAAILQSVIEYIHYSIAKWIS
ncbi:MAG: hypothetical protein LUQ65_09890 [Candidatus Helarchaeota archaeon]|nr:hypothetical protein [Candidatus Helarchaeota archaeon]